MSSIQDSFAGMQESMRLFFTFIGGKLSDYKNISLGEQIAYPLTVIGLLCLIIAVILFLV